MHDAPTITDDGFGAPPEACHLAAELLPLLYEDVRSLARRERRRVRAGVTLQTTALVHDVILRLIGKAPSAFGGRSRLLNSSARMMRPVLVDRARKAQAEKRGGRWIRDDFSEALELPIPDGTDLAMLDGALVELEGAHQRMSQVVELRYFMGLSVAEIADTLGVDERTIHRDWSAAREWLRERLDRPA